MQQIGASPCSAYSVLSFEKTGFVMEQVALFGRVAIVTGSGRRIGRAIALRLARAGASVVINSKTNAEDANRVAKEVIECGGKAVALVADVGDPAGAKSLIEAAIKHFGGVDILVNNAAIRPTVKFSEMTYEQWRLVQATILDGAFLCSHAALPYMVAGGRGRLINIGGLSSQIGNDALAHVVAAKAGLLGLTKALAREYGPKGVLVNCLSPGLIEDEGDDEETKAFRRKHVPLENIPVRRSGRPDDVARAVEMLCGDNLTYLTGQTIHLNGGVFLW